jgi:hypothetical protein
VGFGEGGKADLGGRFKKLYSDYKPPDDAKPDNISRAATSNYDTQALASDAHVDRFGTGGAGRDLSFNAASASSTSHQPAMHKWQISPGIATSAGSRMPTAAEPGQRTSNPPWPSLSLTSYEGGVYANGGNAHPPRHEGPRAQERPDASKAVTSLTFLSSAASRPRSPSAAPSSPVKPKVFVPKLWREGAHFSISAYRILSHNLSRFNFRPKQAHGPDCMLTGHTPRTPAAVAAVASKAPQFTVAQGHDEPSDCDSSSDDDTYSYGAK